MITIARNHSISLNYKNLVFNAIKKKYLYLLLGAAVIGTLVLAVLILLLPNVTSNTLKKIIPEKYEATPDQSYQKTYVVKESNYLWQIAEEAYGSGFNAYDIAKANNLAEPYVINAGQTLVLPNVKAQAPTRGEIADAATTKVEFAGDKYTIKSGDSLWQIALEAYGDGYAWTRIAEANNLTSPDLIHVDNVLIIPR